MRYYYLAITMLIVWAVAIVGWCMNIYKIIVADWSTITGMLIGRLIGVAVAPLGSILGLFF